MQRNSNIVIGIILLTVLLLGVAYLMDSRGKETDTTVDPNPNSSNSDNVAYNNYTQEGTDETPPEPEDPAKPAGTPPPAAPVRLTYSQALETYGTGGNNYRFQFAANCLATPATLTIKKNTRFMIDNRDEQSHTITLGNQTFRLSKFGFAIVTARQTGNLDIKCDNVNRAKILVQP